MDVPIQLKVRVNGRLVNNFLGEYIPKINYDLLKFNKNYGSHSDNDEVLVKRARTSAMTTTSSCLLF